MITTSRGSSATLYSNITDILGAMHYVALGSIAGNGSTTLNISNNTRFILFAIGNHVNRTEMWSGMVSASGVVTMIPYLGNTYLPVTTDANAATIENNTGASVYLHCIVFTSGTVSVAT